MRAARLVAPLVLALLLTGCAGSPQADLNNALTEVTEPGQRRGRARACASPSTG